MNQPAIKPTGKYTFADVDHKKTTLLLALNISDERDKELHRFLCETASKDIGTFPEEAVMLWEKVENINEFAFCTAIYAEYKLMASSVRTAHKDMPAMDVYMLLLDLLDKDPKAARPALIKLKDALFAILTEEEKKLKH
jgi:hypothetical protein